MGLVSGGGIENSQAGSSTSPPPAQLLSKPLERGPLRSQGARPWYAKGGVVIPG